MGIKIIASIAVALITVLPQIWAFFKTPQGYFFAGVNDRVNWADVQGVYFSAIHNFSEGNILYSNPFDWPQKHFFHYPVYLVLGKISALSNLPASFVYHAASFVLTIGLLMFTFKFLAVYFSNLARQLAAFGLAAFGGLYFLAIPEGIGLFSFFQPHFVVAQISLFVTLYCLLSVSISFEKLFLRLAIIFLAVSVLAFVHPWMIAPLMAFCWVWFMFLVKRKSNWPILAAGFVIFSIGLVAFLYYKDPSRFPWMNFRLPLNVFLPLLLYGPLFVMGIIGVWWSLARSKKLPLKFLAIWFIVQIVFVYLPLPFARRFIEGFYLPLAVLAVVAIDWLVEKLHLRKSANLIRVNAFFYLTIGVLANFLILFFWLPNRLVYGLEGEKEANLFLDQNSIPTQRVFSLPATGNFTAGQANVKFFVGHEIQTPDFERKLKVVDDYFAAVNDFDWRGKILHAENICYLYLGPDEKRISGIDFAKEDYFEYFFDNGVVTIYKTKWC